MNDLNINGVNLDNVINEINRIEMETNEINKVVSDFEKEMKSKKMFYFVSVGKSLLDQSPGNFVKTSIDLPRNFLHEILKNLVNLLTPYEVMYLYYLLSKKITEEKSDSES